MNLINQLIQDYPMLDFFPSNTFCWSPKKQQINYIEHQLGQNQGKWTLLHELGHAVAGHNSYKYDIELLNIETTAWVIAKELAETYSIKINQDHIQNCLDSYRDWLHLRSTCPNCSFLNIQVDPNKYQCINCEHFWQVSSKKLCRPYRLSKIKQHSF